MRQAIHLSLERCSLPHLRVRKHTSWRLEAASECAIRNAACHVSEKAPFWGHAAKEPAPRQRRSGRPGPFRFIQTCRPSMREEGDDDVVVVGLLQAHPAKIGKFGFSLCEKPTFPIFLAPKWVNTKGTKSSGTKRGRRSHSARRIESAQFRAKKSSGTKTSGK